MKTTTLFIVLILFVCSCTENSKIEIPADSKPDTEEASDSAAVETIIHQGNTNIESGILHIDSLVELFSIEQKHSYPIVENVSKNHLLVLRNHNPDTLGYYLTLFFTKKYRMHLECCHQGYELRTPKTYNNPNGIDTLKDPILYEFLVYSEIYKDRKRPVQTIIEKPFEFINSGIIMKWLEQQPEYLEFDEIQAEYARIMKVNNSIEKQLQKLKNSN